MDEYKKISGELWALFKRYVENPPKGEDAWGKCWNEFEAVQDKYPNHYEYARDYAHACAEELLRRWEEKQK